MPSNVSFQLSQSYLFFYDKLEKANYYLENSIELADKALDDRLVQYLSMAPLNDGGQWDMVVNLLDRYGVVPQPIYPESFSSSNSGRMDSLLTTKLREHGLRLRKLDQALRLSEWHVDLMSKGEVEKANKARVGVLRKKKEEFTGEIYKILTICLGVPPSPTESFTWEYYDKDSKARSWIGTPREFYKTFAETAKSKPTEAFSLINDPRNEYGKLYTVDRLGNVWGGRSVRYVNTTSERLQEAVVKVSPMIYLWMGPDPLISSYSVFAQITLVSLDATSASFLIRLWVSWMPRCMTMKRPLVSNLVRSPRLIELVHLRCSQDFPRQNACKHLNLP